MIIRPLTTLEECRKVASLEKTVWGYADAEDVVPPAVLIVSIKRGGILLGAFDEAGEMRGFVYSIPALRDGRPTQWSHTLGVAPDARDGGLGLRLKLAQREHAMRMGIDLIEWTYDPLQALNAHLNFTRLGVVVETYEENIYGDSSSPLHKGTPTDRFVAEWRLTTPHVQRRLSAPAAPLMRDSTVMSAVLVNPSRKVGEWLEPAPPAFDAEGNRRLLVEIPAGFGEMQLRRPDLALEWRMTTRKIFQTYFGRGYRAVDFFLAREAGRGQYLLAQKGSGLRQQGRDSPTCTLSPAHLSRRPRHLASAEQMKVDVEDGLACVRVAVEHGAIPAVRVPMLSRDRCGGPHHLTYERVIVRAKLVEAGDMAAGNHEHVRWRLRRDVFERHDMIVLMNDGCGNLPRDDPAEKTIRHVTS